LEADIGSTYRNLVGGKGPFERPRKRLKNEIKMDLTEKRWDMDVIGSGLFNNEL
jgi:hypothetical protein